MSTPSAPMWHPDDCRCRACMDQAKAIQQETRQRWAQAEAAAQRESVLAELAASPAQERRLRFARWLVATGRLSDGQPVAVAEPTAEPATKAYRPCDTCGRPVRFTPGVGWAGREHTVRFRDGAGYRDTVYFACAACWDQHYAADTEVPVPPAAPTRRVITPAQLLANVAAVLLREVQRAPYRGQMEAIRNIAEQLAEETAQHARGELPAKVDDGSPF